MCLAKIRANFRGPGDVLTFLRAAVLLVRAQRQKGSMPLEALLRRFTPAVGQRSDENMPPVLERYVSWWLSRRWFPVAPNCWTRSLALFALLRRHGFGDVRLRIGMLKRGQDIEGHAWLVRDGTPYLERSGLDVGTLKVVVEHPSEEANHT